MLDSDIAKLYQVETKRINEAVKNNPNKFPERFSFVINNFEKIFCGRKFRPQIQVVCLEEIHEYLQNKVFIY